MKNALTLAVAVTLLGAVAAPSLAGHANPWADGDDTLLNQYHDDNQVQSENTSGEDEMLGVMTRSAHGKLGTTPGGGAASDNSGQAAGGEVDAPGDSGHGEHGDQGGHGEGGGGHGAGNGGGYGGGRD